MTTPQAAAEHWNDLRVPPRVHQLTIGTLLLDTSPRSGPPDPAHAHLLAESGQDIDPVLVHAPTLRVLDGHTRVHAALLRGQTRIAARLFTGSAPDAFVLAVAANVRHGVALTRTERVRAAERIVSTHPERSDRAIAAVTALSADTVAQARSRATAGTGQSHTRIGRDGRVRPLDGTQGRLRAAAYIASHPTASLRTIAQEAGISPGTARDVRERLRKGEDPLPSGRRPRPPQSAPSPPRSAEDALARLLRDPALRHNDTGRLLLRLLDNRTLGEPASGEHILQNLPPHSLAQLSDAARACADRWLAFSRRLERLTPPGAA
ncbi:transcriptional regulator [Streptomyces monashensis]|jgi:ParB-like chromosome segregation protein Spo0J|uniref:transcriptional regulator n=1 Tax=Streptomyces monashensis TaxID=1678012 RepID=UPI0033F17C19